MDDALRLADMYADRVYDYRRHASPETHHDMMVFRNALEGKLRRQHAEIAELRVEVERLQQDHGRACKLVADMHAAATGRPGEGPCLGVVEDVAAVRAEVERLREMAGKWESLFQAQARLSEVAQERADRAGAEVARLRENQRTLEFLLHQEMEKIERLRNALKDVTVYGDRQSVQIARAALARKEPDHA